MIRQAVFIVTDMFVVATLFGFVKKNTQRYTFWCLIYGSFKENPFLRCYLCWCKACKHLPSIWYLLLVVPGQPCLSISCLFNLQPPTWEDVWCNKGSDGNMITEPTLIAIWEGLEITFSTFLWIMMALCCILSMLRQYCKVVTGATQQQECLFVYKMKMETNYYLGCN